MEFKELFALQPGDPIISLGARVVYRSFDLPADPPINEAQQLCYIKAAPEKKEVVAEPKRNLTKAEKNHARKQERIREREARQAKYRLDLEAAHLAERQKEQVVVQRNQAPVANAIAAGIMPAQQVHQVPNLLDPAVVLAADAVDPGTRRTKFWEIISRLNWRNASDGGMPAAPITALFNGLSAVDKLIFKREYEGIFNGAIEFLRADGMFDRNGAVGFLAQAQIVSHIIALGVDQYTTLTSDPMILQFLIEAGECQSLNFLLPADIKV